MFEIGWTEMLVIAVVMIVVVGPKDLPKMLRTFGRTAAKLRSMAGDFQKQFNEALKEAELDDVKKSVDSLRSLNPANEIKKSLNPFEKAANDVRAGLQTLQNTPKPAEPAATEAVASEPLKNGATAMPGEQPEAPASNAPQTAPASADAAAASAAMAVAGVASQPVAEPAAAAVSPVAEPAVSVAAAQPTPAKPRRTSVSKTSAKATATVEKPVASASVATAAAKSKASGKSKKTAGSAT